MFPNSKGLIVDLCFWCDCDGRARTYLLTMSREVEEKGGGRGTNSSIVVIGELNPEGTIIEHIAVSTLPSEGLNGMSIQVDSSNISVEMAVL
jgi:hypothetical protein